MLNNKRMLELRHQRTEDVLFDYIDQNGKKSNLNLFIYNMIETLLPKANYKEGEELKMMEMYIYFNFFNII